MKKLYLLCSALLFTLIVLAQENYFYPNAGKMNPACRPSKRISSDTPKTSSELSSSERERFKRDKRHEEI